MPVTITLIGGPADGERRAEPYDSAPNTYTVIQFNGIESRTYNRYERVGFGGDSWMYVFTGQSDQRW